MTDLRLSSALARGAIVVTPNNRLARDISYRHDEAQRAMGLEAWTAARSIPWSTFVGELWQGALDAGVSGLPCVRLDRAQSALLWQRVVARDLADLPLVNRESAASLAAEAWERMHAYGEGGTSWRGFDTGGADVEAFVRWADAFQRETARLDALDLARAADAIASVAPALPGVASIDVVCAGFLESSPQERRLLAALAAAGARIDSLDSPILGRRPSHVARAAARTPREELMAALAWARERANQSPQARVAVVVQDLAQARDLVQALAEEVLCPGLQWPGREHEPRPYDISAGSPLDAVPVVATALDLVALAHGPLDTGRATALVRARHLPGDIECRARRAGLERRWREEGRRRITLRALLAGLGDADPLLASRWRSLSIAPPSRGSPREFADFWRSWLDTAGWCDGVPLHPAEREARGAWAELLAAFPRLAAVAPRLSADEALATLRTQAGAKVFQPDAPSARIRILGLLEAAGLSFDALWVAGLSAEAWPRAPEPNPLLPFAWQRTRDVPRATPARELAYARLLTETLSRSAPEVVFSHAQRIDDHPSLPSPLIADLPEFAGEIPRSQRVAHTAFRNRPPLDCVDDDHAPEYGDRAPFRGGAALIESFSACPFQATTIHRLDAPPWPIDTPGLPPPERGKLVHAAFAAFWRELRDHATLIGVDPSELDAHIARAVAAGRAAVDAVRWDALPPVVAAEETLFVARLMRSWIDTVERPRPPFTVVAVEQEVKLGLAGHLLRLRVDRVDRLQDGRTVIVDYKTGEAIGPEGWFGERPQGPQLGLYAMAGAAGPEADLAGLAYAQLKPGKVRAVGLAADAAAWPALATPDSVKQASLADWNDATARLYESIEAIGQALHRGDARVAPRESKVCRRCGLQSLCRITAFDENGDENADENGEENGPGVSDA